jgi:hypothetical protein
VLEVHVPRFGAAAWERDLTCPGITVERGSPDEEELSAGRAGPEDRSDRGVLPARLAHDPPFPPRQARADLIEIDDQ